MKYLIISPLPIPSDSNYKSRIHFISRIFKQNKDSVLIISTNFNNGLCTKFYDEVEYKSVSTINRNTNFIVRQIQKMIIILNLFQKIILNKYKFDVLIVYPSLDFRVFIILFAKLKNKKVVLEINEFPYVNSKYKIIAQVKRALQFKLVWKLIDGFIVISEELKKIVFKNKNINAKVIKIPILSETKDFSHINLQNPETNHYIFHAGSLYEEKDGILGIIEAFGNYSNNNKNSNLSLIFTGSIKQSNVSLQIVQLINKLNIGHKVKFLGFISSNLLDSYYKNASFIIINKNKTIQNKYCFATKIAESLSYQIPIITTNFGESMQYLSNEENAFIANSDDTKDLEKTIEKVINYDPNKLIQIAKNGSLLFEKHFNFKVYDKVLNEFIKNIENQV